MKTITLYRHSTKINHGDADLSPSGIALARQTGQHALRDKKFTHLLVSGQPRTFDTSKAFAEGAKDFIAVSPDIFPLEGVFTTEDAMRLWNGVCHQAEKVGEDMMLAALENDKARAEWVAKDAAYTFRRWLASLPEDARVLVVHHSPAIELLVYGLFDEIIPQLQPCEGVEIIAADDRLRWARTS